jgi:hypothetical protein
MKDTIISALKGEKFHYDITVDEQKLTIFKLGIRLENTNADTFIHLRTEWNQVLIYTFCPIKVPANQRLSISEFITLVNSNILLGNFEMDFEYGEIRYKSAFAYDDTLPYSEKIFLRNLYVTFNTLDKYFPGIMAVIYGNATPTQAIQQIENVVDPLLN